MRHEHDPSGGAEIERIRRALAASAAVEPAASTDARVRLALAGAPAPPRYALRPGLAAGLALAALFSLVVGLATGLAQAGAAETGPLLAAVAVWIYLALSAAATLPLLLHPRTRRGGGRHEVWR